MYRKMGFDEQNPINYLKQIIIPFVENGPEEEDARNILGWLADNWEYLIKDIDDDRVEELISILSESQIIFDGNRYLKKAKNYYHPNFFSDLPILLQDKRYSPLKFEDNATQKNWLDLLSKLGASTEIICEHIVTTVQSIIAEDSDEKAIALLNYISNHFEWFDEMEYDDENIFKYLSSLEWVPVEKPTNGFLVPEVEYKKLRKPSELILKNDFMIAGGTHYRLSIKVKLGKKDEDGEFTERDIAKKLGILIKLPIDSVFKSFRRLRSINGQQFIESKILDYSKEFYRYLERSYISDEDIPMDIKEESVFIKGHWLSSSKVFQTSINLTGIYSWDELVANDGKESPLAKGLIKLGVLAKPDNEYLVSYLRDLPQNQQLDKQQLKDAKEILKHLQKNFEELDSDELCIDDMPLLSRSDKLISSDELYLKNLPAYDKANKKNEELEFCHQSIQKLAKSYSVTSLAKNIKPELYAEESEESEETNDNRWEEYIRSDCFKSAVLRLIYHEDKNSENEIEQGSLDNVLPSSVLLMDTLTIKYFIDDIWIYDDPNASTYPDIENSSLYLLNQDDDEDMCESIAKFITDSSGLNDRDSFSLIGRILRNKYKSYEEIHDLLDKKNIKELPEKFEIDESDSLFGNNSVSEKLGVDDENSLNKNSENEQSTSDITHSSTVDDTQSEPSSSSVRQKETQSGAEIPRPISPKKSNTVNKQDKASPSDEHNSRDHNANRDIQSGKQRTTQTGVEIPPPIKPKKSNTTNKQDEASFSVNHNSHKHNVSRDNQNGSVSNRSGHTKLSLKNREILSLNSNKKIISSNDRKPLYVGKEREVDSNQQQEEKERAIEIGNRGENYVLERSTNYLLSKSNKFKKAPTNNKGYDILERDTDGEIVRYIEVKTLTGRWGEGGVAVTESQLEFAQVYDNWWLFVVENINTQNTTVHMFENPVQQANRFMFDHSWKQLAKKTQSVSPKEGDKYRLSDGIYEVSSIKSYGSFYKVTLKGTQTGKELKKKFDHSWEKC